MKTPEPHLKYAAPVLRVADLARSLSCYRDCLGFEVEFNYEDCYASVVRDGCRIHFKHSSPPTRDQAAFEAAAHLDAFFSVEDIESLASSLTDAGAAFFVSLRQMPDGREFYVRDPDGYILGFIESLEA